VIDVSEDQRAAGSGCQGRAAGASERRRQSECENGAWRATACGRRPWCETGCRRDRSGRSTTKGNPATQRRRAIKAGRCGCSETSTGATARPATVCGAGVKAATAGSPRRSVPTAEDGRASAKDGSTTTPDGCAGPAARAGRCAAAADGRAATAPDGSSAAQDGRATATSSGACAGGPEMPAGCPVLTIPGQTLRVWPGRP